MKIFADKEIRNLFCALAAVWAAFCLLSQLVFWVRCREPSLPMFLLALLLLIGVMAACFWHFYRRNQILERACAQINAFLAGDPAARLDCDKEGGLYRLFHCVNTLASVLNAHADNELAAKEFLKNTISDISHQIKTPLAALSIYNGLLQESAGESEVKEFAALSEQELDRIESLVQSLLKITRLDAGAIVLEKVSVDVSDLLHDAALHFAFRAKQEQKELILSGEEGVTLFGDRDWLLEAADNLVKNALDHTGGGDTVQIAWEQTACCVKISVKDSGSGIPPEDFPHIFKRFYRSKFAADAQGVGLGLPLAKAIVEAHGGTIEADSEVGKGSAFVMNFPNGEGR